MSEFVDAQAEESSDESYESDGEPAAKRSKKHTSRKHQIRSDDEEEEDQDDDARLKEEMRGFVVDDESDDNDSVNSQDEDDEGEQRNERSDHEGSDGDELLEDDLELVNENIGLKKRARGGRVQFSDDDEQADVDRIREDLFGQDDFETNEDREQQDTYDDDDSRSGSDQSEDPFIVQDDAEQRRRRKKKGAYRHGLSDQCLDEAKEIFGYEDIEQFYDDEALEDEGEDLEEGVSQLRVKTTKSLWDTIEPSELAKGFVSAADKRIILDDRPERFQLRRIPVTEPETSDELDSEKQWIYNYAFATKTLSKQQLHGLAAIISPSNFSMQSDAIQEIPNRICDTLNFIRKQVYEVPFIAFYRKEYVDVVEMRDLWKIYRYDEKWCRLQQRKKRIYGLLERVERFYKALNPEDAPLIRKVTDFDYLNVDGVQSFEQLSDVYAHFQLYYGNEMRRVQAWEQIAQEPGNGDTSFAPKFKMGARTDKYLLCIQCGLAPLAEEFGLTPRELAENYTEYVKHEVRQSSVPPKDLAREYLSENFSNEDDVLKGAAYVLAQQFSREPALRRKLRERFYDRLHISVHPTKKGEAEIDENHPLFGKHYIKDKPVSELQDDEYLKYNKAKEDGFVEIELYADTERDINMGSTLLETNFFREPIFHREEFYYVVDEWNKLRKEVLRICVNELLVPVFQRDAHERLMEEGYDFVLRKCADKLADRLTVESYKPPFRYTSEDEDEEEADVGVRIMTICYSPDQAEASFALVIDQDGVVLEHIRLIHFIKRVNSRFPGEDQLKKADLETLRKFILRKKPHVIGINGEDLNAMRLCQDVVELVKRMVDQNDLRFEIPVEITDSDAAKVYMNSQMAMQEFSDYPPLLKQCLSLARYILDPLVELAHLCNADDDIAFMKFHPLQDLVPRRDFLFALQMEFINRVNEVGVDINRCLELPYTAGLLQFVCGLGPRKASHLLKILKQNNNLLESRTKLVTSCKMGPKVFMNASGFIKIDTSKVAERTDEYVEVLDGSRVHPETYEWARKMAVDALEIDDPPDPTAALEEILQYPERLRDLDLDAFADELSRQGFGNKSITLYDIRAELNFRYKDLRMPHRAAEGHELYDMLVRDGNSCAPGKLVSGRVMYIVYRKPDALNDSNSRRAEMIPGGLWECCYCKRSDFPDVSDVWAHIDKGDCPGMPMGVRIRLDNGLMGFVALKNISDNAAGTRNPAQRLVPGNEQVFRVLNFNFEKMSVDLSCKSSDLRKSDERFQDKYFDTARYNRDREAHEKARNAQTARNNFVKRVISHPSFHNVTFKDAERMLRSMEPGEVVVRPSAKAVNYLTVTWKVCKDIYQHINIREAKKDKVYDIGKVLYINGEQFEDLDEIIARHIQPMAGFSQDIMSYKYFMSDVYAEDTATIERFLFDEKRNAPARIPYTITASAKYPGKFVLSYLVAQKIRHEYMSATPEGIKFRSQHFTSAEELINWFKGNFMRRPDAYRRQ